MTIRKGNIPQAGMEYIRKLRDVKYYETISDLIAKQFEIAKLDEAREGALVQVVDPAVPPDSKSSPKRTLIVLMAILLSFFAACVWFLIAEVWLRMNRNPVERQRLAVLR